MTRDITKKKEKKGYLKAFLLSLFMAFLVFIPYIIWQKGIFVYYIDFDVQQITFYKMCHEAVRSGSLFWNWQTDLGANFIGSYSFYLLGSPFFWLTLIFPNEAVPYLMGPLLMLKTAFCGLTAYAYLRRFTKTDKWALLGSLLYAFCGFNAINTVFNHFHEAVIIFPLMLIAMEEHMINNRRGWFCISVAAAAVINYFFFAGQAMFLIIYFVIRSFGKDFQFTWKKFFTLFTEAVLGVLIACCILVPSAISVLGNPRTSYTLSGYNVLIYSRVQRYFMILQSMFFPQDNIMMPNFFNDTDAHFSSVSLYLPMFSVAGVIVFFKHYKKTWLNRILVLCLVMALVPVLNSAFFMFNGSYYARWYYMPILLMALATVLVMENSKLRLRQGIFCCIPFIVFFAMIGVVPNSVDGVMKWFSLPASVPRFWAHVGVAVVGMICLLLLDELNRGSRKFYRRVLAFTCVFSVAYTSMQVGIGCSGAWSNEHEVTVDTGIYGGQYLQLDRSKFFRMDSIGTKDNLNMLWGLSSMECFHSIVPGSVMEFYETLGYDRGVGSRAGAAYYGVRGLASVKYMFCTEKEEEKAQMPGFVKQEDQLGYKVYENEHFIPMGFTYDRYMTRTELEEVGKGSRDKLMVDTLVLEDEAAEQYGTLLEHNDKAGTLTEQEYLDACDARAATAAYYFAYDNRGFTSRVELPKENLVFFSVPYEKGWTVTVDDEPAEVIKANVGFMAVQVPEGEHKIRFSYMTPGLKAGICITLVGLLLFALYLLFVLSRRKQNPELAVDAQAHRRRLDYFHEAPGEWPDYPEQESKTE